MLVPLDPLKLLELDAKQLANRPAHLPRVQTPVHTIHMEKELLEYTIQGDPRTRLKYIEKHRITPKLTRASKNRVILLKM